MNLPTAHSTPMDAVLSFGELFLQRLEHLLQIEVSIGVKTIYGVFAERLWLSMTDKYCSMIFIVIIFCIIIFARRCLHTVYMKPLSEANARVFVGITHQMKVFKIYLYATVSFSPMEKNLFKHT
jgi:hypothetical protein